MKKIRSVFAVFIVFSMLLTALSACTINKVPEIDGNKNDEDDKEEAPMLDISGFSIIRPDVASSEVIAITSMLKTKILNSTGANLSVKTDDSDAGEYEILIGNTNRDESKEAFDALDKSKNKEAFIIKASDKKIAIVGFNDTDTMLGVKYFINEIVKTSQKENCISMKTPYKNIEKTGELLYKTDDLESMVVLEQLSTIDKPESVMQETLFSYGKIIKLEHSGENNGILFATSQNINGNPWPLYRSDDDGKTWTKLPQIVDEVNGAKPSYQPYLYELPEDMGDYKAGTLLFAACSRRGLKEQTIMMLQASRDLGMTWEPIGNVEEGGCYNQGDWSSDGLWEPVLEYEDGKLYCFYSDELENGTGDNHVGGHNQRLVYKYTTDLKSWSDKYEMVALEEANLRPGMVALTKMGDGRWALVFEIVNQNPNTQIYIKFADSLDSWDADDKGKSIVGSKGGSLGSGPAIAWTPGGGECGTLFVTANHDWETGTKTKCGLFLSFDYGKTWVVIENPIPNMPNQFVKSGYSAGMFVDEEGTLYYVNNPEDYSGAMNEKLMFARIKVY